MEYTFLKSVSLNDIPIADLAIPRRGHLTNMDLAHRLAACRSINNRVLVSNKRLTLNDRLLDDDSRRPALPKSGERNTSIDVVRYMLLYCVILLHSKDLFGYHPSGISGLLIIAISNTAVPFFFISAGLFLKFEKESYLQLVWKPLYRIVPLYAFWFSAYALFIIKAASIDLHFNLRDLMTGGYGYHLWFLPSLISALIINGVIRKSGYHRVGFIILLLIAFIGLIRGPYHDLFGLPGNSQRSGILIAPLFVWLGTEIKKNSKKYKNYSLLSIICIFGMYMSEYAIISKTTYGDWFRTQPFIITSYLMAFVMLVTVRKIPAIIWPKFMIIFSKFSFGLYAVHLFIIFLILPYFSYPGVTGLFLFVGTVFITGSLISYAMSKTAILRRFVQ